MRWRGRAGGFAVFSLSSRGLPADFPAVAGPERSAPAPRSGGRAEGGKRERGATPPTAVNAAGLFEGVTVEAVCRYCLFILFFIYWSFFPLVCRR